MRTKLLGLFLVGALLLVAVPAFASAQSVDWWTLVDISVFNGACVFQNGVSAAPVNLAINSKVAGTEVSVPAFSLSITPDVGVMEFMITPAVPSGATFDVLVNGNIAFSIMQVIDCQPASAPPAAQDRPGDSFVCELQMPQGFGHPLYAQLLQGDEQVRWNGYLDVVEGQLQFIAHPGADQLGPWLVTAGDWSDVFEVRLVGPKVCEVVAQ